MTNDKTTHLEAIASVSIGDSKSKWTRIGVAFPLKKRPGFSVRLEFLPAPKERAFEFILVEPSERPDENTGD